MDGQTIKKILSNNIPNTIIEVIAIDQLKRLLISGYFYNYPKGTILVVNSQNSFQNGEHWFLIYFGKQKVIFVDSLLKNPKYYGVGELDQVETLDYKLQGDHSTVCALYIILFAILLSRGLALAQIANKFSRDTCANDLMILAWYKECRK